MYAYWNFVINKFITIEDSHLLVGRKKVYIRDIQKIVFKYPKFSRSHVDQSELGTLDQLRIAGKVEGFSVITSDQELYLDLRSYGSGRIKLFLLELAHLNPNLMPFVEELSDLKEKTKYFFWNQLIILIIMVIVALKYFVF